MYRDLARSLFHLCEQYNSIRNEATPKLKVRASAKPHFVCDATAALPERCISSGSALRICSALHTCAMHFHALQTLQCTLRDAMVARASLRYGCHRSIILHSVRHCKPRIDKYK